MKITVALVLLLSFALQSQAQEMKTIFGPDVEVRPYGSFFMEFSSFNRDGNTELLVSTGGGGALSIGGFYFGGYGQGLSTQNNHQVNFGTEDNPAMRDVELGLRHGGFWLGGDIWRQKIVHLTIDTKLGWGKARWRGTEDFIRDDRIFTFIPQLGAELNFTEFLKVAVTGGYRFVAGSNLPGTSSTDFNSPVLGLTFKVGYFAED